MPNAHPAPDGARNLRRQIQKDLEDPIATLLIERYADPVRSIHVRADRENLSILADPMVAAFAPVH